MPQGIPVTLPCDAAEPLPCSAATIGSVQHQDAYLDKGVHPFHQPAMPSHADIKASLHYPVVVTPNPMVKQQSFNNEYDVAQHLNINNGPMSFDSELFSGKMEVHLKGLPSTTKPIFDGKKRYFQIMVQGKFKRPVEASALCMGQEFVKAGAVPPWVGEVVLTAAAKAFSNSTQVDVYAPLPYFMNPVLAACQLVNVSKEGEQPALTAAQEDLRLFSSELVDKKGNPFPAEKRRKWCDVVKNLEGKTFDTEHVWTFHIWQHLIDFSTYRLSVGGFVGLDLAHALNGQPLQLTVKDTKEQAYAFSMLVWHEQLIYAEDADSAATVLANKLTRLTSGFRNMLSWSK